MSALQQSKPYSPETTGQTTTHAQSLNPARTEPAAQKTPALVTWDLMLAGRMVNHPMISAGAIAMHMQSVAAMRKSPARNALSMFVAVNLVSVV